MNPSAKKKTRKTALSPAVSRALDVLIPLGIALGAALILLLVSALVASSVADPAPLFTPLALASLYLSAAVGGFVAALRSDTPLLTALETGAALAVFTWLLSIFDYSAVPAARSTAVALAARLAILPATLLGALPVIRARTKPRSHKRR